MCEKEEMVEIEISLEVKEMLDDFKLDPAESYNAVLERLLYSKYDHEPLSEEEMRAIEQGMKDYKEGKFYTLEEAEKLFEEADKLQEENMEKDIELFKSTVDVLNNYPFIVNAELYLSESAKILVDMLDYAFQDRNLYNEIINVEYEVLKKKKSNIGFDVCIKVVSEEDDD